MGKKYQGKNSLSMIRPLSGKEVFIRLKTQPKEIHYILRVIESYSHLAFPVQIIPSHGLIGLHTTKEQVPVLLEVLQNIPRKIKIFS